MLFRSAFLVSLAVSAIATPARRALIVQDKVPSVPPDFVKRGTERSDSTIKLRIGLKSKDTTGLENALHDVSTPGNSLYGHHLSKDEVTAYAAPAPETVAAVNDWLKENNITGTTHGAFGEWIAISLLVSQANKLLDADFETFVHTPSGTSLIRTLSYSVPDNLFEAIDVIHPTTSFTPPMVHTPIFSASRTPIPTNATRGALDSCSSTSNPQCLEQMYGIPATPASEASNVLAVAGFGFEWASNSDLQMFLSTFRPDMSPDTTFVVEGVDGGTNNESFPGFEASLDIQYTVGLATGVPVDFVSVGLDTTDGDLDGMLDMTNFLNSQDTPPTVLTVSYGFDERTISKSVEVKLCNAFMALTSRGTSVLFASGDGGVAGSRSQTCVRSTFIPTFPAGCPYVTSVGATDGDSPEIAANLSSGGFSNTFPIPDFQSSVVSTYLDNLGSKYSGQYNSSGRGFPDVAARHNVTIFWEGISGWVTGTSCSSPIFASLIALINDRLIAAGKPVLGWLNPFLYSNPQIFTDVVAGSNPGCGTDGFPATTGWDPVTGLGTPKFEAMLAAVGL